MRIAIVASLVPAVLLAACAGPSSQVVSGTPSIFDKPPSGAERVRAQAVRADIARRLASGMSFRLTGTARHVVLIHGVPASIDVGPGNVIRTELVRSTVPQFALSVFDGSRARQPKFDPVEGTGDGGGGSATPAPNPTAPPNAASCSSAGGAAWADFSGFGCLGAGSSRQLTCGTWQYLARGRGRLVTFIPGTTVEGSWIADDGNGNCGVGP